MKTIKFPDKYDTDLFCDDNKTVLKADKIVSESVKCPFCNHDTDSIIYTSENEYGYFGGIKSTSVYTSCSCKSCGAKWESDRYRIKDNNSYSAIRRRVLDECRKKLNRNLLII